MTEKINCDSCVNKPLKDLGHSVDEILGARHKIGGSGMKLDRGYLSGGDHLPDGLKFQVSPALLLPVQRTKICGAGAQDRTRYDSGSGT